MQIKIYDFALIVALIYVLLNLENKDYVWAVFFAVFAVVSYFLVKSIFRKYVYK